MYIDTYCNDAEKTRKVTQCSKANGKIPKKTTVQNDDIVEVLLTFAVPRLAATRWVVELSTELLTLAPRLLATRKGLLLSTGT